MSHDRGRRPRPEMMRTRSAGPHHDTKSAESVGYDCRFTAFANEHSVMTDRLVARRMLPDAVPIKRCCSRLADHIFVNEGAASVNEIAVGKLLERWFSRLPLWINRQNVIFAADQLRSRHSRPGKNGERRGLRRRAVFTGSGIEEHKAGHWRSVPLSAQAPSTIFSNKRETSVPESISPPRAGDFACRGHRAAGHCGAAG